MIPSVETRGIPSPFRRLLLTDFWDGPKGGLAVDSNGAVYAFDLLDWDEHHSVRVFSIAAVPDFRWIDLKGALQPHDTEDWTEWVLPVSLPPEAEALLQRAEIANTVIAVVATSDLLATIEVWRPVAGPLAPVEGDGWLESLGLPRRGRSQA